MAITNFIPTIWSARVLANLHKSLVYGQTGVVNRDYEGEIREKGDTVKILSIGSVTVSDYAKDTDISSPEALTDADQVLTIEKQKYFNFAIDDVDKVQSNVALMDAAMAEAAYALGDTADQYIASLMAANVATANISGSDASPVVLVKDSPDIGETAVYDALVDLRNKLTRANVPSQGRWVIVPPEIYGLLLKAKVIVENSANPQAGSALMNGQVGFAAGFRVLESNNVLAPSDKYRVIAGYNGATAYADQINKVEAYRPEKRFADAMKGLHLYGAKVTRPQGLAMMIATVA